MGTQALIFSCERPDFTSEESALVARARKGDNDAFTALVNQHYRRIYRLAKRIMQNEHEAEEVLQDTFLKAYEHMASFRASSKFSTWLTRIAMNEALMKLRKRRKYPTVSLDEPRDPVENVGKREVAVWDGNPEQQYFHAEIQGILEQALEGLRPNYRTVFLLRDVEELSLEEAAETLGISLAAAKSRLFRARMILREKLARRFNSRRAGTPSFAENAA